MFAAFLTGSEKSLIIVFIFKQAPSDQGAGTCREACLKSIARLNCSYLDLFLIHWPSTQKLRPEDPRNKSNRLGSWSDMEQLFREGVHYNFIVE